MARPGHPHFFGVRRLISLTAGLPPDARSVRADPNDVPWGMVEELLAQLVELTSLYASDRRLKEPRSVPRPGKFAATRTESASPAGTTTNSDGSQTTVGLGAATAHMAEWAARNGGVGGNSVFGKPPKGGDG